MNRGLNVDGWQTIDENGVIVTAVTDEIHMRGYYEEWLRLMNGESK
jgi:hypothetical protein